MSATRGRRHHSSARPPHTQNQTQSRSHGRSQARGPTRADSRRSHSPHSRHQSSSRRHAHQNSEEGSPNTFTGRELSRALNKASERGTQGKEM